MQQHSRLNTTIEHFFDQTLQQITIPISGIAGLFPIHPRSYMTAWRNRKTAVAKAAAEKAAAAKAAEDSTEQSTPVA